MEKEKEQSVKAGEIKRTRTRGGGQVGGKKGWMRRRETKMVKAIRGFE